MSELNSESTSLTPSESLPVAPLSSSDSSASASKPSIMDSLYNLTKNLGTAAEKVAETTSDKISSGITQASDSVSSLTNELVAPPPLPSSSEDTLANPPSSENTLANPPSSENTFNPSPKTRKHGKKRCNPKRKSKIRPKCISCSI